MKFFLLISIGLFTLLFCNGAFAAVTVTTTLDINPPPANPAYTASTGLQMGRLVRSGSPSTCAAPKANPGVIAGDTTSRQYDTYVFTAASTGCVTVTVTASTTALFVLTYNNSGFVPASPSTNYLADTGTSGTTMTYSFNVTAGQQFTVVIHEVTPSAGVGQSYTLNVSDPVPATAAALTVRGRVLTANGRGIAKAFVIITNADGDIRTAITNPFGYYRFSEVPAGGTYIFSVRHKSYQFAEPTRTLSVLDDIDDMSFFALP